MKVAVIGSKVQKDNMGHYRTIKTILEQRGMLVDFSHFNKSLEDDYSDLEATHKKNQKIIKNCDFMIADLTQFSTGIGYMIANAISLKKPVLSLFNKKEGKLIPQAIKSSAMHSKLLKYVEYREESELDQVITNYVKDIKQRLDTKFILIISPDIDRYLEWASGSKRMHKAQIVRTAMEELISRDKEYKKVINEY